MSQQMLEHIEAAIVIVRTICLGKRKNHCFLVAFCSRSQQELTGFWDQAFGKLSPVRYKYEAEVSSSWNTKALKKIKQKF